MRPAISAASMEIIHAAQLAARRTRTDLVWTPAKYAAAVRSSDTGTLREAADFASWLLDDGRVSGAYEQALSFLGKAPRFESMAAVDPAFAHQLGYDLPRTFSEAEQEALALWGFHFGIGIARAEYVFLPGESLAHEPTLTIETWDMRWFYIVREYRNGGSVDVIYADTETGRVEVTPGEGWLVFMPYGAHEAWKRGLWKKLAKPVLTKQSLAEDRNLTSEVTPLIVGEAEGLSETQRKGFLADLSAARGSRIVLPRKCKVSAVDVGGGGSRGTLQKDGIDEAKDEIAVIINGQAVTMDGSSGFSNGDVQMGAQEAITRKREGKWSTCLGEQWAAPWTRIRYGYEGPTIYPRWIGLTNTTAQTDVADVASPAAVAPAGTPQPAAASPANDVAPALTASAADDAPDETVLAYAADMNEAGVRKCEHGRTWRCDRCGIERTPGLMRDEHGELMRDEAGDVVHATAWRPIRMSFAASTARVAAPARRLSRNVTLAAIGDDPPTRVQLFTWGENDSDFGPVYLTKDKAAGIMKAHGVGKNGAGSPGRGESGGFMFDLEHLSLDPEGRNYDPSAYGWGTLGLDATGLYVDGIKWTPEGDAKIRSKKVRFISPAFDTDKNLAITKVTNAAITALPATRYITPLVAASATATTRAAKPTHARARGTMDEKQGILNIAMIAGLPADAAVEDVVKAVIEKYTGNAPAVAAPDADPAMAELTAEAGEEEALSFIRSALGSNAAAVAALDALHVNSGAAARAAAAKAAEDEERRTLLSVHAAKFPTPQARDAYAAGPIEGLRTFVKFAKPAVATQRIPQPRAGHKHSVTGSGPVNPASGLTDSQAAYAAENKIDPIKYAAQIAAHPHLFTKGQA